MDVMGSQRTQLLMDYMDSYYAE